MLSFQKAPWQLIFVSISDSLVVIHQHSLYPLLAKNNTLGEVYKINLRTCFAASQYDFHLCADDSKKKWHERHAVGVPHTWNSESQKPEGYILGYSLLSSASGRDQVKADYHIIRKQFGIITNVAGMVDDNAQTQTGHKS